MTPTEIILSMIPSLTPTELESIRKEISKATPTPCELRGHDFQFVDVTRKSFFRIRTEEKLYCKRCGCTKEI